MSKKKSTNLIIVESNAKVDTIKKILKDGYDVVSCQGHIRDLPEKSLGVDIENQFTPEFTDVRGKGKVIKKLKKSWKDAEVIYLAPDPDREGEAIAWHLSEMFDGNGDKEIIRITFNAITSSEIQRALSDPHLIDINRVDAQFARRILDRLVGYKISPLLWKTVKGARSAGRVQSVALRILWERELERREFVPDEYWSLEVSVETPKGEDFTIKLIKVNDERIGSPSQKSTKRVIGSEEEMTGIVKSLEGNKFEIVDLEEKETKRYPKPPFITSSLQRQASSVLRFSARKTMRVAQSLYEGKELGSGERVGLITYMRTDSVRTDPGALNTLRGYIENRYGGDYLPEKPIHYKVKKRAQDAHEAIRPTNIKRTPESIKKYLNKDEYRLYRLIWQRFTASQMTPAVVKETRVDIYADGKLFRARGIRMLFPGFFKVYPYGTDKDKLLPELKIGDELKPVEYHPRQHFTKPPPRFTESSLVRELENNGIGRPSTYAPTISRLLDREYITRDGRALVPTDMGGMVVEVLVASFPNILDIDFTARVEDKLDEIERGKMNRVELLRDFYNSFEERLDNALETIKDKKESLEEVTDIKCEKCGADMIVKYGRRGKFLGCSNFPECDYTANYEEVDGEIKKVEEEEETVDEICEECGAPMEVKYGKYGKFLGCSNYPDCKNTKPIVIETGVECPREDCDGDIIERRTRKGRIFYGCSNYPDCDFALWNKPYPKKCPECGNPYLVIKGKKPNTKLICPMDECDYEEDFEG